MDTIEETQAPTAESEIVTPEELPLSCEPETPTETGMATPMAAKATQPDTEKGVATDGDDGGSGSGIDTAVDAGVPGADSRTEAQAGSDVTSLPSTGSLPAGPTDIGNLILVTSALSFVALAGGFAWRQRRVA